MATAKISRAERTPSGAVKRSTYGWKSQDDQGEFTYLEKRLLRVDDEYQRQEVSKIRVDTIARDFSWPAFGVILVAKRVDNRYYVFDGQHRLLASYKRDDIQEVPCLVFEFDKLSKEARAFIDANTCRGPVTALQKFNSRIVADDAKAISIVALLDEFSYRVPRHRGTHGRNDVICVEAVERVFDRGTDHARRVIDVWRKLCLDSRANGKLLRALSCLDRHLVKKHSATIKRADIEEKLLVIGEKSLIHAANVMAELTGRSGEKIWAAGIANAVNQRKRSKRIDQILD